MCRPRPRPGDGRTSRSRRSGSTAGHRPRAPRPAPPPPPRRSAAALARPIAPATMPFVETSLEWQLFDDLTYDLPHTLPFVCDQVGTFPRSTNLMLVATRPDFVSSFAKAWKGMGFTGPILIP